MATELGTILKHTRQSQRLTQKQLADGICSQSMLSAIEQNQYTPNAQLLIALCQRLNISLDELVFQIILKSVGRLNSIRSWINCATPTNTNSYMISYRNRLFWIGLKTTRRCRPTITIWPLRNGTSIASRFEPVRISRCHWRMRITTTFQR